MQSHRRNNKNNGATSRTGRNHATFAQSQLQEREKSRNLCSIAICLLHLHSCSKNVTLPVDFASKAMSSGRSGAEWFVPGGVARLDSLAMDVYLSRLQEVCYGYVQLKRIGSVFLDNIANSIIPFLRVELNRVLSGTMSTSVRQDMIQIVMSGKYPTSEYRNQYELADGMTARDLYQQLAIGTDDQRVLEDVRKHGSKCSSVCCTGAFVVETMLSVIVHRDVRELKFSNVRAGKFFNINQAIQRYVSFQIPLILQHYKRYVAFCDVHDEIWCQCHRGPAQLQRLYIRGTDTDCLAYHYGRSNQNVMQAFDETR